MDYKHGVYAELKPTKTSYTRKATGHGTTGGNSSKECTATLGTCVLGKITLGKAA